MRTDVPHHIAAQSALGGLRRVFGVGEFAALQRRVRLRNMPRQAQHQPQRQLGGGVRVTPRRIEHADTTRQGGFGIDVHRIGARAGDHLQTRTGGDHRFRHLIVAGHQHLGVVGQLDQLVCAQLWLAQRPAFHPQFAQLLKSAEVAGVFGGKNNFHMRCS